MAARKFAARHRQSWRRAAEELKPQGLYEYGQDDRVMTQLEAGRTLVEGTLPDAGGIVMIQCVGQEAKSDQLLKESAAPVP